MKEDGWRLVADLHVGGLTDVGISPNEKLILVVSHDGRGLFDCKTGERVARDRESLSKKWHDPVLHRALGIGPLAQQWIPIAGLFGGTLPQSTPDGWWLDRRGADQPRFYLADDDTCDKLTYQPLGDFRVAGFSSSGRILVLADSAGLQLIARPPVA